ncbi:MAG TPA: SpoIIE family protein phosphatase [Spirochaetia bacterium]|nr:SpoIIE family protein phosphatase [Spirochaetia bacterium]
MERLSHSLAQSKLFAGLTAEQVSLIQPLVRQESFAEGVVIVRQSMPPSRVYLLMEGRATVRKRMAEADDVVIAELTEGDFFGELGIIRRATQHSASVVAESRVKTCSLGKEDFTRLLSDYPPIARNILSNIVLQLDELNLRFLSALRAEKQVLEETVRQRTRELESMGERLRRELVLAQSIQRNLLPEKCKSFPGVTVTTDYVPCEELGGDITGVFAVDESHLAIYGGDVCGHGIYAAMVMSYVKKLIETSVKRMLVGGRYVIKPPGAVLTAINHSFMDEISMGNPEIYLTLFLGVLDLEKLSFEYSSAGTHVPPLVVSNDRASELFDISDYPIGHVSEHEYSTHSFVFSPGETFLFLSDGVVEARRGTEVYGIERVMEEAVRAARAGRGLDVESVVTSVRSFLGDSPPQDDMCLLAMSLDPKAGRAS